MRPFNVVEMLFALMAILCSAYLIYCFIKAFRAPAAQREGKALVIANTEATRENNELLRELIALNRQLLEKQNQANS
jgi:threonine/homoserine/homoserine lactone efflux protein